MKNQTKSAKSYHHGHLRETLIEAGMAILEEEGIHALSLRKVAKRAEVSHAAPYRHFEDKLALLSAIAEAGFNQLADSMEKSMEMAELDSREQAFEIGRCYVRFGIEHPAQLTLMFSDLLKAGESKTLSQAASQTFTLLTQSVANAQKAGFIKQGDPAQIAQVVWALEHGLAMLMKEGFLDGKSDETINHKITEALEHLMSGLAK